MAFLTFVDDLGAVAQAGEWEEATLASTAAEEEQSDHFEKKESTELPLFDLPPELPKHVLTQDEQLASYTNEVEAYVQCGAKSMQTISHFVHAGTFRQECLRGMVQFLPEWG